MHFIRDDVIHAVFQDEQIAGTEHAGCGTRGVVGDAVWTDIIAPHVRHGGFPDGSNYELFREHRALEVLTQLDPNRLSSAGNFTVRLLRPDAVIPTRAHVSDAGFDVTVTHLVSEVEDVQFYGTGVGVRPPLGYFFLLFPRSSLSKTPYVLANGVGVIDPSYQGEIIVALRKIRRADPDLDLPCRVAQLVPTVWHHMNPAVVGRAEGSSRGEGGFGSTGAYPTTPPLL